MDTSSDVLVGFVMASATYRYIWIAAYAWALYDWVITLNREIDLVWRRRSGAWQSKSLFAFIRYSGLATITFNIVVVMRSNWSVKFCRVYFYLTTATGMALSWGMQVALLLWLSVMSQRSFNVMATSIAFFVIELVSMSIVLVLYVRGRITSHVPPPATGCYSTGGIPGLQKTSWCIFLVAETYLCILALRSAYSHWKATETNRPNILTTLIRDSLLWHFGLVLCLFMNIVASTTGTNMLTMAGMPSTLCMATVGGSRFLLNLRATYFSSTTYRASMPTGVPRGTQYTKTEGTVGMFRVFRSDLTDQSDDGEEPGAQAIEMGDWATLPPPGTMNCCPHQTFCYSPMLKTRKGLLLARHWARVIQVSAKQGLLRHSKRPHRICRTPAPHIPPPDFETHYHIFQFVCKL